MATKWYLHDAATTQPGTYPGASSIALLTITVTASGAATNRQMNTLVGSSQVSAALSTSAVTTQQSNWFRRWISPLLGTQTIPVSTTWTISLAASESNANSDMFETGSIQIIQWRPSGGGSTIQRAFGSAPTVAITEPGTSQTAISNTSGTASSQLDILDGDVIVLEIISTQSQAMGVSYTNTIFYDGTTEASNTNCASFLQCSQDLALSAPPRHAAINHQNPGLLMEKLGARWKRRWGSGLLVPEFV